MLLLASIWGASFLSVRIALDEIGPLSVVAHCTLWAMLTLWGVVLGAVVLGETLQPSAYAGFALLAIGLIVLDGRIWRIVRRWGSQKKTL